MKNRKKNNRSGKEQKSKTKPPRPKGNGKKTNN